MKQTGTKNRTLSPQKTTADDLCPLCGKPGNISFRNSFVCEDCLGYIKTITE